MTGEDKLFEAERDAILSGTKQRVPDVSYMLPERLSIDKSVVHHLDEVVQVSEGRIGPSVVLITGRDQALRVAEVLEATPRRDKCSQWLSSIRKWNLPRAMTGVHLRKPLGGADVRQQVAWRGHRVGWSLDLRAERLQVDGQSFFRAIFLVNDHDGVAPVSGFCDWFDDAFCHHVVELLLDLLAVSVRDWTGRVHPARLGIGFQDDVHVWAGHGFQLVG